MRSSRLALAALVLAVVTAPLASAVVQSPPQAVRAIIDGLVGAVNRGSGAEWEAYAQKHFADALLKKESPDERLGLYLKLTGELGANVTLGSVMRRGPDAPLEMTLKGSKAPGRILLTLADGPAPKIAAISLEGEAREAPLEVNGVTLPPPPVNGTMTSGEIEKRLDGYFTKLAADEVFSGVALVAKNGVPVFLKAYGLADREKKIPNTIRTRFNIGSINKTFTQVAIRQLILEGKLSPFDTLGKFFPDYAQAVSRAADVEQLLGHRAGVADFFGAQFTAAPKSQFASNADYFKFISSLPAVFSPGERSQYCNGCYIVLGAIVEKVSGMPYEQYVAEHVFARAEMTSTGYPRSDQPAPDIAQGYTRRGGDGSLRNNLAMHGVTGSAAGGGYSTALDLLTYVKAIRDGKFRGADANLGIAGGAPGTNAVLEASGDWVVIVLTNFDPPAGERLGVSIATALSR